MSTYPKDHLSFSLSDHEALYLDEILIKLSFFSSICHISKNYEFWLYIFKVIADLRFSVPFCLQSKEKHVLNGYSVHLVCSGLFRSLPPCFSMSNKGGMQRPLISVGFYFGQTDVVINGQWSLMVINGH